jgi:hypothetical protein
LYTDKTSKVYVYIDDIGSCLCSGLIEFYAWIAINKFTLSRFRVIKKLEELGRNDVFFTFLYGNLITLDGVLNNKMKYLMKQLSVSNAYKVVHLSHYGYDARGGAEHSRVAKIDLFVSETNLQKNSDFFKFYYSWYTKDVYVLPFVPHDRFYISTDFSNRLNKAVAIGTLTDPIKNRAFVDYFKGGILQPMRFEIFKNSIDLGEYLDSYISEILNPNSIGQPTHHQPSKIEMLKNLLSATILHNIYWELKKRIRLWAYVLKLYLNPNSAARTYESERTYMKFDIVQTYNRYKMFVNPEEVIGLPGIGFVEGMACGCAYIGLKSPMYSDIGMVDGVHYIGYDGSIYDLKEKIHYYQFHEKELSCIANNGFRFIRETCCKEKVMGKFLDYLKSQTTGLVT